MYFDID